MAFKPLRTNTKQKNRNSKKKHTGAPPKHIGSSLPTFQESEGEEDFDKTCPPMDYIDIPDEFLAFPDDLDIGDNEFRHILFEGAHCLL